MIPIETMKLRMPRLRAETHFGRLRSIASATERVQARIERICEFRFERLETIRAILSLRLMSLWLSV